MRSWVIGFLLVVGILLSLPPMFYAVFPHPVPELPPAGRFVEVAGNARVNVIDAGLGPTVVLVHGHPGTAYEFEPLQRALVERGFRVIAYDRIGYGRSDARPWPEFTVAAHARELHKLLEVEDLRDVTLLGYSYGGGVVMTTAREQPDRIARVVLLGSVGPGIEERPAPPRGIMLMISYGLRWAQAVDPLGHAVREGFAATAFAPEPVPEDLSTLHANFARPHTLDTMLREGFDLDGRHSLDPADVPQPMLIIQGDGDQLVPAYVAERLHERRPDADLWLIEGGGHGLHVTRPAALAERIAEFVDASPSVLVAGRGPWERVTHDRTAGRAGSG